MNDRSKASAHLLACVLSMVTLSACSSTRDARTSPIAQGAGDAESRVQARAERLSYWSLIAYSCEALGYQVVAKSDGEIVEIVMTDIEGQGFELSEDWATQFETTAAKQRAEFATATSLFSATGPNSTDKADRSAAYRDFLQSILDECRTASQDRTFSRILRARQ